MAKISSTSMDEIYQRFIPDIKRQYERKVYCMAGIPASGKSTFVNQSLAIGTFPKESFILDPDRVMRALPEYQNDYKSLGAEEAFANWEMPARSLAYDMFDKAFSFRVDIIKDMGCARIENFNMLAKLKDHGYSIDFYFIYCDVAEAIKRSKLRDRYTPEAMIKGRYDDIMSLLPKYIDISDKYTELDNSDLSNSFVKLD